MAFNIPELIKCWQKRNIPAIYCDDKNQAREKILEIIPKAVTIGISGSVTLDQLEIVKHLESRGNKVFSPYKPGISREENLEIRRQGAAADFYLASANAIAKTGELVFFSGFGNRIAGISYAENVIIVAGINKITQNLEAAIKRAREYATPLNCKRLNWETPCFKDGICRKEICFFPPATQLRRASANDLWRTEYKRMCCQILIIEAEVSPERLKVVLVGEELGY